MPTGERLLRDLSELAARWHGPVHIEYSNTRAEEPIAPFVRSLIEPGRRVPRLQSLKTERPEDVSLDLGFDHYEMRSWLGWHHHMLLSFLVMTDQSISKPFSLTNKFLLGSR
jgi:hypothetical protein